MKWAISGADRETGRDVSVELEAETETDAVKAAGARGMFVERVRAVPPEPIPYASPAQPPWSSRRSPLLWAAAAGAIVLVALAGIGALTSVAIVRSAATTTPPPPAPTPAAAPELELTVERVWFQDSSGVEKSAAFSIRNDATRPVTISGVRFNGEFSAVRARDVDEHEYWPHHEQGWPVTLTVGERALAFHRAKSHPPPKGNYAKDVLRLAVVTNQGVWLTEFK